MTALVRALVLLFLLCGCKKTVEPPRDAAAPVPSAAPVVSAAPLATCTLTPKGGLVVPGASNAYDVRIGSADGKAVVTWLERRHGEGPDTVTEVAHDFDGTALGPRLVIAEESMGDEFDSGAAPVVYKGKVGVVECHYAAPSGQYGCGRRTPIGAMPTPLFSFTGIQAGGPQQPGIAALQTADDALVFVPEGAAGDVLVFGGKASKPRKAHAFSHVDGTKLPHADGLAAALDGDEAVLVYRYRDAVLARRAGFDEAWHGKPVTLSQPGTQVGAPVVASRGSEVIALFSERAKGGKYDVRMTKLHGDPQTVDLAAFPAEAQGPGIAAGERCFVASWVEGSGKTTRTKLAPLCNGTLDLAHEVTVSTDGVEGGRAYLAKEAVVWQELPGGKPELRIAKLGCP